MKRTRDWMRIVVVMGTSTGPAPTAAQTVEGVHDLTPVASGIWVAQPRFGGATATVIVGEAWVTVVDPHSDPATAAALVQEIRGLTELPIRFVVNTHWHGDHHGGNRGLERAAGGRVTFIAQTRTAEDIRDLGIPEARRLGGFYATWASAGRAALETGTLPGGHPLSAEARRQIERWVESVDEWIGALLTYDYREPDLLISDDLVLLDGRRTIRIEHPGAAHTGGDLWVRLPEDGVIVAGDLLTAPYVVPRSGYPASYARVLRRLAALDAPVLVLGHGGPIKAGSSFAMTMADFLDAAARFARAAVDRGLTDARALAEAGQDPEIAAFEPRIDWDEAGLRFLDFSGLVEMTVGRALAEAREGLPPTGRPVGPLAP